MKRYSWSLLIAFLIASGIAPLQPGKNMLSWLPAVAGVDQENSNNGYQFKIRRETLSMPDGVKLAVTYWMPVPKTAGEKFPAFFEMNGYRKDDFSYLSWDYPVSAYFARHGYVVAKVDLRGTGDSDGVLPSQEYSEQELSDCVEIIKQLAARPWSNGNVGMYGMSWGAFNSLMVARRKPPALKAILIAHVSDDLYYQDVHFMDGVMHTDVWESMMDACNALPDTRRYAITPSFFASRFDQRPWLFNWKEHGADGAFWRKESARFNAPVDIPIYVIGGLLDGYRDTVIRLLDSGNKQIIAELGPFKHSWPHNAEPGPAYEWRQRGLRWFDHWLKGIENGVMKEPRFSVFMRDAVPPDEEIEKIPGQWRCGNWPVGGINPRRFYLSEARRLADSAPAGESKPVMLAYRAGVGAGLPGWWGETTGDMSKDDKFSMVFDSAPLAKPIEIIGTPKVNLNVSADAPLFNWSVRLEDVFPNGTVSLVSGTFINPTDRVDRLNPSPLPQNVKTRLSGEIHFTTWRFRPGHKIRIAVCNAQFPTAWPTPYKGSTKLYPGIDSSIELPVVEKNTLTATFKRPGPQAEEWPPDASYSEENEGKLFDSKYDPSTGAALYSCGIDQKMTIGETNYRQKEKNIWKVNDRDPAHATWDAVMDYSIAPPGRNLRLLSTTHVGSDEKNFNLSVVRQLFENKKLLRENKWEKAIPRGNH